MNIILSAQNINSILVWLCIGITLFASFGYNLIKKLWAFNKKHHCITFNNDNIYDYDDESDEWNSNDNI